MEIKISGCKRHKETGFVEMIIFSFYIQIEGAYVSYSSFLEYESNSKNKKTFLPFRELTVEILKGWILDKYSTEQLEEIESSLLVEIDSKINHPYEYGLPWEII